MWRVEGGGWRVEGGVCFLFGVCFRQLRHVVVSTVPCLTVLRASRRGESRRDLGYGWGRLLRVIRSPPTGGVYIYIYIYIYRHLGSVR